MDVSKEVPVPQKADQLTALTYPQPSLHQLRYDYLLYKKRPQGGAPTLHPAPSTPYTLYTVHSTPSTLYTIHPLHHPHYTLHSLRPTPSTPSTLHPAPSTPYTLYTIHPILGTVHAVANVPLLNTPGATPHAVWRTLRRR